MNDYKETLNLPTTSFPMKASLATREPKILAEWESSGLYQNIQQKTQKRKKFILHDGPPYANGAIHLGHAVNKVLKDIIIKSKLLSNYSAPFVPGWDCHGLPIELSVEKKLGTAATFTDGGVFRNRCRQYAAEQVAQQSEAFQRLGVLADWKNPYLTMDSNYEANVLRVLAKIYQNGHMSRRQKPVYWCTECQSALAEAEVEYIEKKSPAIDVSFQIVDPEALVKQCQLPKDLLLEGTISIVIWTTTPWTLPANQAVAVHPDFHYVLFSCVINDKKRVLIVAKQLLDDFINRVDAINVNQLTEIKGSQLELLQLQHPFYNRKVPVILGTHVTEEAGTGCVHTAPAHGEEDYEIGLKYDLPVEHQVMANGYFSPEAPLMGGQSVLRANQSLIEILDIQRVLISHSTLTHSYPHCWRHKKPLIFRSTPQWFVSMDKNQLRHKALQAIEEAKWLPDWGQARIKDMIAKRPDWCISRQRNWGVPIALFIHRETNQPHPNSYELLNKVADRVEKEGIEAWFKINPQELLDEEAEDYIKVMDTLDVWFDAGASYEAVLQSRAQLSFPADVYLEGSDQYRGWFHSSLLSSVATRGVSPYRQVITHGFTVDANGQKMSKSLGNIISPDKIIKTLGADILRLWIASTDYRSEMTVSDEIMKQTSDLYRRIRNTCRFLLANLADYQPEKNCVPTSQLLSLDLWVIEYTSQLQQDICHAYQHYHFHRVVQKIHYFCSVVLGGFYLDIIKDRLYTTACDSRARRSAQTAMYDIIQSLTRWLAPILSFTAEEVWQELDQSDSKKDTVFLTTWYEKSAKISIDAERQIYWQKIMHIREQVNKQIEVARKADLIGSNLTAELTLYCQEKEYRLLSQLKDELRFVFITSKAKTIQVESFPDEAIKTDIEGIRLSIKPCVQAKCIRCWHHDESVGQDKNHPEICYRCISNVDGSGEIRSFV